MDFLKRLKERPLVGDGAMGTELSRRGMQPGQAPELWNLERPDAIRDVHQAYVDAGCEGIIANTFGANRLRLEAAGLADRAVEIAAAGVRIAREAAGDGVFVFGDLGPTGHEDKLPPYGTMDPALFTAAFGESARALAGSGVDAIYIETMSSVLEADLAVRAVREATDLPILCSLSFRRPPEGKPDDFRTFWGDPVERVVEELTKAGADVLGTNCGEISEETPRLAALMRRATDLPLAFEPNAGSPKPSEDGSPIYDMPPERFGALAAELAAAGANLIGGCCGTTPAHLAAARAALGG
jgi:5-methyltetrahydrofolate--homocysteine methyltransferase